MPTTEERLAALETKLAALTETTPTTYYEHQYSGEEIDAAVGRALTGGALDTSVTNVSNQLGTFVRPNLLDNWYFGNPVDQRKGYIQIAGTMMYKDTACTDQFGPSAGTTPVVVYATYARPIDHGVELALYIPLNNIVRGYMGNGYAVDRWWFDNDSNADTISLTNAGIKFSATAGATGVASVSQKIPQEILTALAGKTVTLSAYGKTDTTQQVLFLVNGQVVGASSSATTLTSSTYTFPDSLTSVSVYIYGRSTPGVGEGTVLAAKLELGPTQTLAHREGDKWVLNEVPDYGEQLRRCQRYSAERKKATGYVSYSDKGVVTISPMAGCSFPTTMRVNPSCSIFAADVAKTANKVSFYSNFETLADGTVTSISADDNGIYVIMLQNSSIPVGTIVEFCYVANADL